VSGLGQGAATQIFSQRFDQRFFALPAGLQWRVQEKIDEMGTRLRQFPHYRMQGADTYRLRVGDYRIIYQFDAERNELRLIAIGHRRDIYK
jgi:mRNA interferase RelE/StbE